MIDFDNATPQQLAEYQRDLRSRSRPGYAGLAVWWVLDLLFIGLGVFMVFVVSTSTISGSWLPLIIIFVICGAAVLFAPVLVKWTLDIPTARAEWDQEYGRGRP